MPKKKLVAIIQAAGWVDDFSAGTVKLIGALEVMAAVGPDPARRAPHRARSGSAGAVGLVFLMLGAVITRLRRHEPKLMLAGLTYLALAAFVAWGRFGPESFTG